MTGFVDLMGLDVEKITPCKPELKAGTHVAVCGHE